MHNTSKNPLYRHYRGIQHLRKDLKHSVAMCMHEGMGDVALRVYMMHQRGVQQATNDPFVVALAVDVNVLPEKEKAKIGLVNLLTGQLYAYLEDHFAEDAIARYERHHEHFHPPTVVDMENHRVPPPPPEVEHPIP